MGAASETPQVSESAERAASVTHCLHDVVEAHGVQQNNNAPPPPGGEVPQALFLPRQANVLSSCLPSQPAFLVIWSSTRLQMCWRTCLTRCYHFAGKAVHGGCELDTSTRDSCAACIWLPSACNQPRIRRRGHWHALRICRVMEDGVRMDASWMVSYFLEQHGD